MKRIFAIAAFAMLTTTAMAHPAGPGKREYDVLVGDAKSVMMDDPAKALAFAKAARRASKALPPAARPLAEARAEWLEGEALARMDKAAEAQPVLDGALTAVLRVAPRDPLHGDVLLSRGWAREACGRIAASLADFQDAFRIYRAAGDQRGQAKALQNIAGIYQDAGDNERAQRYYAQSGEVYQGDPAFALAAHNNAGESLRLLGRYGAAERQYTLALRAAREEHSPLLEANVLTNLAATVLKSGDMPAADRLAQRALELSSVGSASDERPFAWGVLAQIAASRGDYTDAETLIGRTFAGVDLRHSSLRYLDFHRLASDIYARTGEPALALEHMRAWKRLDDGVRAVAASTNAALMAARFDFSTQNMRIAQLQANRAHLHEMVLAIVTAAVGLIASLLMAGVLSLRRSRNAIRAANRDLTKALEAKSEFLAMTSHEIRTPLNGILGMTQVILADRSVTGTLRSKIELVNGAGETMRALVDDILDLSKMENGGLVVAPTTIRPHELLTEAADLWRARAETKGLLFELDLRACPEAVEEDGDRLRQIVFNLLSNAVKFTEDGTVVLRAEGRDDRLVISVADTGIGIAPHQHELIFDKFQQADASTSRRYGGTGLGLAICRSLASAMGGSISVQSEPGAGATFTLELPLRRSVIVPKAAVAGGVVLLEPNALTQRMMAKALGEQFGPVHSLADDERLLSAIVEKQPRFVVTPLSAASDALIEGLEHLGRPVRLAVLLAPDDAEFELRGELIDVVPLRRPFAPPALAAALRGSDTGVREEAA